MHKVNLWGSSHMTGIRSNHQSHLQRIDRNKDGVVQKNEAKLVGIQAKSGAISKKDALSSLEAAKKANSSSTANPKDKAKTKMPSVDFRIPKELRFADKPSVKHVQAGEKYHAWSKTLNGKLDPNTTYYTNNIQYNTNSKGLVGSVAGEAINLMAQNKFFNKSEWITMENTLKAARDNPAVQNVSLKVKLNYGEKAFPNRPSGMIVWTNIDGQIQKHKFKNAPGGK